ncbi:hypothetical protein RIR_jg37963.t1 [Rhizophagus irregularis DAOM 181602=DAOM 197198]|nr:hypothetical protein RIR_jg37963.t1 [Rhizophagus irregularis DAOM 181602=DAOM 197198]
MWRPSGRPKRPYFHNIKVFSKILSYKKRKFGICPEKYGKCPEIFHASGKHLETAMFGNIFWTLDSGQILDKFWSVKKMSGICASGKCSKT